MFKLTWKVDGKSVPAERIGDEIKKSAHKKLQAHGTRVAESMYCPVNRQNATVFDAGDGQYRIHGCCDGLIIAVSDSAAEGVAGRSRRRCPTPLKIPIRAVSPDR